MTLELGSGHTRAAVSVFRSFSRRLIQASPWLGGWLVPFVEIMGRYRRAHGRFPNLLSPKRFTEKMQWRKLFDLNPLYVVLSDKIAAREFVRSRVGSKYLIPLMWTGDDPDAIPFDALEPPYVIKSNHGCGQVIFVEDRAQLDKEAIRAAARSWLAHCYGTSVNEPGYIGVPRRLLVERLLLRGDGGPPRERKVFVFGGRASVMETITIDPQDRSRWKSFHTTDWKELPWVIAPFPLGVPLERPARLTEIIDLAERLGAGLDHVRIDLYDCDDKLYVGELTLYSNSGLVPPKPDEADLILGSYWPLKSPARTAYRAVLRGKRVVRPSAL